MSTELQRQVSAAKKQHVQAQSLKDGRASIFLSAKDAAGVDVSTVLEAAVTGIKVLGQYDKRFDEFLDDLLHESSIDVQRELKTKEENAALDQRIEKLLQLLTPWAFEPSAHLVLEYLVRRYRIHELNTDQLIRTLIVAHDTPIFGKVLHLCKLSDGPWSFLVGAKDNSSTVPRTVLVRRVVKNSWLLEAITERALTVLRIGGIRKISKDSAVVRPMVLNGVCKFLSFYTAIVIEVAEQIPFDEARLRHIFPYLTEGFKTHFNPSFNQHQTQCLADWKISSCLIVSQLSKKTRFGVPLCKSFCKNLGVALLDSKSGEMDQIRSSIAGNVMMASCILCQHGQLEITPKFLAALYKGWDDGSEVSNWLFDTIKQLSDYDTSSLISCIVWSTLKCLVREEKESEDSECGLSAVNLTTLLCRFIQQGLLSDQMAKDLLQKIFSLIDKQSLVEDSIVVEIRRLIKSFSNWLPATFDSVLKSSLSSKSDSNAVLDFLSGTFSDASQYCVESFDDDNLYVSLCSPIRELRIQALKKYGAKKFLPEDNTNSTELVSLAQAALRSCIDSDFSVASVAWQPTVAEKIILSVPFEDFKNEVENALEMWISQDATDKKSNIILSHIFKCIGSKDIVQYFEDEHKLNWLMLNVISFIAAVQFGFLNSNHIDQVQESVVGVLKVVQQKIGLFSEIELGSSKKTESIGFDSVINGVSKTLKQSKSKTANASLKTLVDLAIVAGGALTSRNELYVASTVLLLVILAKNGVHLDDSIVEPSFRLLTDYAETTQSNVSYIVLKTLFTEGTMYLAMKESSRSHQSDVWQLILNNDCFPPEKIRLAKAVMGSASIERIELVDLCLESLFPVNFVEFLQHVVVTEKHYLQVVAMSMLASFVECKCLKKDIDEKVLVCGVISLWACVQSDEMIRKWGLLLCSHFAVALENVHSKLTVHVIQGDSELAISISSLHQVCRLIQEKTTVVQLNADTAVALVKQALSEKENHGFRTYLWTILTNFYWKVPSVSLSILHFINESPLDSVWVFCSKIFSGAKGKTVAVQELLDSMMSFILSSFSSASKTTQALLIDFLSSTIKEPEDFENQELKQSILSMLARGMLTDVDPEEQNALYELLMERQLSRPGDTATLDALAALNMRPQVPLKLITTEVAKMSELSYVSNEGSEDEEEMNEGYSIPLQRMVALLEAAVPTILRYKSVSEGDISALIVQLFCALHVTNRREMKSILSIEYYKAVILEALSQSFLMIDKHQFNILSKGRTKSGYSIDRSEKDLIAVMQCLGSLKSVQIQGPSFVILQSLIKLDSKLPLIAIKEVGDLLSSPTTSTIAARDKFLTGILELLVSLIDFSSNNALTKQDSDAILQSVIQSLCVQLPQISNSHRLTLLRSSLKVLQKESYALMTVVHVLLMHTVASYENDTMSQMDNMQKVEEVCLSRSAQRRAKRVSSQSGPEEFYSLAKSLFLEWNSHDQIKVLSQILGSSLALLNFLESSESCNVNSGINVVSSVDYLSSLIQVDGSKDEVKSNHKVSDINRGFAATLAFLHMEFVLDIMESKSFHRQQAKMFSSSSVQVQRLFLEVADGVLKLIAATEAMKKSAAHSAQRLFKIRFESDFFQISLKAMLEMVLEWSLETLHSLQRLLDGPSFISIMQELFSHELLLVRQRAVRVLKDRLQQMLVEKTTVADECVLYFDLSGKMRSLILQYLSQYSATSNAKDAEGRFSPAESALAQSSIMCLDVLIQYLGSSELWKNELMKIVQEFLEYIPAMYTHCCPQNMKFSSAAKALDTKKLLGSVLLCTSTAFKMLHVGGLPFFPKIMDCLGSIFKTETAVWNVVKEEETTDGIIDFRAHVLFARSVVSSQNLVIAALPSFVHPHLNALLRMMLDSYVGFGFKHHLKEFKGLSEDASTGLNIIATKIPPRLLIPALATCISTCMGNGHIASQRMAQLVLQVSKATDRATSIANMAKWMTICFEMMDYRRKHGDFTSETDDVEEVICDSMVVLCLKLTESELKSFILKMVEWKSSSVSTEKSDVVVLRRSRAFYVLIKTLVEKLKFLFHPTMSLLWNGLVQDIELSRNKLIKTIEAEVGTAEQTKKRKRQDPSNISMSNETEGALREILNVAKIVLSTIQILCDTSSNVVFINQNRYEEIYPKVLHFLTIRLAFSDEQEYLDFVKEYVAASLSCICLTTTRDSMWKPINHQVLLQTRHSHPSIRKAAIKTLQHLFQEVGEEYLLLLPECLPFISELLEDDNTEVVACTRDTISSIEELSGESLDSYLKN